MCQGSIVRVILKFGIFLMKMRVVLIIKRRALPGNNLSYISWQNYWHLPNVQLMKNALVSTE